MLVGGTPVLTAGNSHLSPGGLCLLLLDPVDKHPPWKVLTLLGTNCLGVWLKTLGFCLC